jgi:hypothetical protein
VATGVRVVPELLDDEPLAVVRTVVVVLFAALVAADDAAVVALVFAPLAVVRTAAVAVFVAEVEVVPDEAVAPVAGTVLATVLPPEVRVVTVVAWPERVVVTVARPPSSSRRVATRTMVVAGALVAAPRPPKAETVPHEPAINVTTTTATRRRRTRARRLRARRRAATSAEGRGGVVSVEGMCAVCGHRLCRF